MNKTKIEWCDFTWNPVVGCKNGCRYCYARRVLNRFHQTSFSKIKFYPGRIDLPRKRAKPATIFVGSMSDIEYWKPTHVEAIMDTVNMTKRHIYMFLSKNAQNDTYRNVKMPANCWKGVTVTTEDLGDTGQILCLCKYLGRKFVSFEPMLGNIAYNPSGVLRTMAQRIDLLILGAMSGPKKRPPKREWVDAVFDFMPHSKIFLKDSIFNLFPDIKHQNPTVRSLSNVS